MKTLFIISTEHGGLFSLFYLIAFLVAIAFLYIEGHKRKYPMSAWLLIIASGVIFFVIGNKLLTYSFEQIKVLFTSQELLNNGGKTVLGGILGGLFGFELAKKWLKFKGPFLDTMAIMLPIAMAIQRVGCLMAGCCYGKPTNLPWGIQYGVDTSPFHTHVDSGLISSHESASLLVHPTQLYQIIYCLLIAFIVWRSRKYWKSSGSMLLFSIALYAAFRFCSEFLRDPHANHWAGELFLGLKIVQWGLLVGILALSIALLIKERYYKSKIVIIDSNKIGFLRKVTLLILLLSVLILGKNWFEVIEKLVLYIVIFPVLIILSLEVYKRYTIPGLRWVTLISFCGCFLLMGQTIVPADGESSQYTTISFGSMTGKFKDKYEELVGYYTVTYQNDCGGISERQEPIYSSRYDNYKYWLGGLQVNQTFRKEKYKKISVGSGFNMGNLTISNSHNATRKKKTLWALSPYCQFDIRWVGVGIGANIGNLYYLQKHESESYKDVENTSILPQVHLRVGPYDVLYIKFDYGTHFPSSFPSSNFKIGIGSGLGTTNGANFNVGLSNSGMFLHLAIPVKSRFIIEPYFAMGNNDIYCASLSFRYRFNIKTRKVNVHTN